MEEKIIIGITHGDINGIGYEVILKTLADSHVFDLCTPVIYGSSKIFGFYRKQIHNIEQINTNVVNSARDAHQKRVNIVNCLPDNVYVEPGQPTADSAKAAMVSLEKAVEEIKNGYIDVLITAPINKKTMDNAGFGFPGHTEYIQERVGDGREALMILMNDVLRVALVTTHLPIREVAQAITKEVVMRKIRIFHEALRKDFNVEKPRIAVLALNPHAGDGGLLGAEEQDVIIPAIEEISKEGIICIGPYPADGFFGNRTYDSFDGVLAMYHDQGLAPFKALSMADGVNFTAGLPIVRTSPDHGTAYDIAGKGKADEASMRQAIYTALDVFRNRQRYEEAHANPLRKQYHERRDDSDKLKLNAPEEKE